MKFCRSKTKFKVSVGFLLAIAAIIYLDGQGLVFWCMLACLLHEAGHLAAINILGGRVQAVHLRAIGAEMKLDTHHPLSYGKEAAAALAGPAVSLAAAWISAQFRCFLFAGINLSFGVLNLIPASSLDGGRALYHMLCVFWPGRAEQIVRGISVVCAGLMCGLGLAAWRRWGNITLLTAALWLLSEAVK